jgi:hypothetical protein
MTMEVPEAIKVAVQGIEMAVEHIAGATAVLALQGS